MSVDIKINAYFLHTHTHTHVYFFSMIHCFCCLISLRRLFLIVPSISSLFFQSIIASSVLRRVIFVTIFHFSRIRSACALFWIFVNLLSSCLASFNNVTLRAAVRIFSLCLRFLDSSRSNCSWRNLCLWEVNLSLFFNLKRMRGSCQRIIEQKPFKRYVKIIIFSLKNIFQILNEKYICICSLLCDNFESHISAFLCAWFFARHRALISTVKRCLFLSSLLTRSACIFLRYLLYSL